MLKVIGAFFGLSVLYTEVVRFSECPLTEVNSIVCRRLNLIMLLCTDVHAILYGLLLCRMNQPTTIKDDDRIAMNTDTSVSQKRNRVSRSQPVLSRKRSFFEEHAAMLAGSLSSSVSSYGSLMDEEEFVRQQ